MKCDACTQALRLLPDEEVAALVMEYLQHITTAENIHTHREDVLLASGYIIL